MANSSRRELKTRQTSWAQGLAKMLTTANITPNAISLWSILFAGLSAYGFSQLNSSSAWWWPLVGAAGIQLRLLCNMMDGLVAVEGGKKTATGDLYNDVPDRIADVLIILGIGYGLHQPYAVELAWFASLAAVMTAYVRCLGASLIKVHYFIGPFAKQHRMAALTFAALAVMGERLSGIQESYSLYYALWIVSIGATFTFWRRLRRVANDLKAAQ